MKLYDSLSGEIIDINEEIINIYNCGPTVYNDIHIGNARPLIVFDVLYRTLLACNKKVNFLHNLTDIDDKIIYAAKKENIPELELSNKYGIAYSEIRSQLNTLPLIIEKVSDNIDGIIDYIQRMIKANVAYEVNGNVYFNTAKINEYGSLSRRNLDEQNIGERVNKDDVKQNETDFVLWKKTTDGIQWNTPWSKGRPGWHSECSYLIEKHFNNNLTIHGGGIDLKFPHHENENAQHIGLHKCHLTKVWMHVGHINVNAEKMSKSLNNFILVKDILKNYSYQTLRWFMYKTNYRNPLDYNMNVMDECVSDINRIKDLINKIKSWLLTNNSLSVNFKINQICFDWLQNDLNIANAITGIYEITKQINVAKKNNEFNNVNEYLNELLGTLDLLGIEFENLHTEENIKLLEKYNQLLENKQYDQSDLIRQDLIKIGII